MEPEVCDAIEDELLETTRQVLRTLGRVSLLLGNSHAANLSEVLCGVIDDAAPRIRRSARRGAARPRRDERATNEESWLPPPIVDP